MAFDAIERRPNAAVAWWLMASYAYYILDDPILTDGAYDTISVKIAHEWETIEHRHKHLLDDPSVCRHGGHYLRESDYPNICKSAAEGLILRGRQ